MNILFTDTKIIDRGDISWSGIEGLGKLVKNPDMTRSEALKAIRETEALFVDSFSVDREMIEAAPKLRFIGAAATGFNHIDIAFAQERGVAVCNVPAYSTEAVAQHAIALLLTLASRIPEYDREVSEGRWNSEAGAAYEPFPMTLLHGKSLGIVGYGNIGRRVGEIASALGMRVNVYSRDREAAIASDVVSLHCPLTEENARLVDAGFIEGMKEGAILINTARGGLVDEDALAEALKSGRLSAAGLDVMAQEPPRPDHPLFRMKNCVITPHVAFTPLPVRQKVVDICADNLRSFLEGGRLNRIDGAAENRSEGAAENRSEDAAKNRSEE